MYDPIIDDLIDEDFELFEWAADLPELTAADVGERPAELYLQDEIEGLGARAYQAAKRAVFPMAPRGWKDAIETAASYVRNNKAVTPGMCLREVRQYFGVPARYAAAVDSLNDAKRSGKAYRIGDWSKVPRGCIVYMEGGGSVYGHIVISLGGGQVISTDVPRGRYGRIHGGTLTRSWGYTRAYFSPLVNGYRAWPRKDLYGKKKNHDPKPKGLKVNRYRVNKALADGKKPSRYERRHIRRVVRALRKKGWSVDGWPPHVESVSRALEKFQRHRPELRGDADGKLGPLTCKLLGIRSRRGGDKR